MKKALLIFFALLPFSFATTGTTIKSSIPLTLDRASLWMGIYNELNLESTGLRKEVFDYALRGLQKNPFPKSVLSIVDLSQPSSKKRLYVIDLDAHKLLFQTYVAHGRNSGELMAATFSNTASSFQSSLGFYQTLGTYQGKHGLSLQLKGLERGFNDNAFSRAIVIHGADYVCEDFIRRTGRLGRSQGCPAVDNAVSKGIIQAIKGGSCVFVYSPNPDYLQKSTFLL
ncbi:murein L,D-transpeptidase catalytic domain family protein [Larkinella sp. VNQ87]|uniref:murein L,D-transpeptidase catalytic domain family protein n=1 Tax=Larkinella sp. VNQ87 TaxID=3400921 RepID=UPI003C0FA5F6